MKNQDKMKAIKDRLRQDFNDLTGQVLTGSIAWLFLRASLDAVAIASPIACLLYILYYFDFCNDITRCSLIVLISMGFILGYTVYIGSRISTRRTTLPLRYHGPLLTVYLLFFTAVGIYMVTESIIFASAGMFIVAITGYCGYRKGISDRRGIILKG